ncbi:MAG: L-rhamnose mutarotase [Phycisphaerales bacterium]|nr:L-rhamnose mutarotase [Phycisphaerales bacterium]
MVCITCGCARTEGNVQRYGCVIGVRQDRIEDYKKIHAEVWPGVLALLRECNIRNYSIYLGEVAPDQYYLFSYFEYAGDDFEKDMEKMKADPTTQKWWELCDPMQSPVPTRREGEWWHVMEEVFYTD